ncbi:MAG TPA: right-handed parallel beta-helix repeat-containing protein, partial [Candidatus Sumerlaeia bacterium]|nr:right-handed parallel beta-helix repeat-containing protein [Candidatus Sumerlaeia bacterium]
NCIAWGNNNTDIENSGGDVKYSCFGGGSSGEGNIDADPMFVNVSGNNPTLWVLRLKQSSPCIDAGTSEGAPGDDILGVTRPQGSGYDMGAYEYVKPTRYYVKPTGNDSNSGESWDAALKTIVTATEEAKKGDEVWVAEGTYAESKTVVNSEGVALYGGFAGTESQLSERNISTHPTIIDGEEARQCVQNSGVLDGFHIKRGKSDFGGGINNTGTVTNCTVYNNIALWYGGGIDNYGMVTNCIVYDNGAKENGGGIYNESNSTVINCTVYKNSASRSGGGIFNNDGTVINCISWKNSLGDILGGGSVEYSCFGEADRKERNIRGNPLFVNTSGASSTWDFRLQNDSPCVDTGSADDAPKTDIMGNPRPGGDGKVCMGAYESPDKYKPLQPRPVMGPLYVSKSGNDANNGLSWKAALKTISAALNKIADSDDLYQVWVAKGTYAEGQTLSNPSRVALYGGFAGTESQISQRNISTHPTIIDGEDARQCAKNSG